MLILPALQEDRDHPETKPKSEFCRMPPLPSGAPDTVSFRSKNRRYPKSDFDMRASDKLYCELCWSRCRTSTARVVVPPSSLNSSLVTAV